MADNVQKLEQDLDRLKSLLQAAPERRNVQEEYDQKLAKLQELRAKPDTPAKPDISKLISTTEVATDVSTDVKSSKPEVAIPPVESMSDYYAKIKPEIDAKINQIQSKAFDRMDRNDRVQALGNVIMNLLQYVRLAGAPAGAPQPAITMPKIDLSNLNEREMKKMALQLNEQKDDLAAKLRAKESDIVSQRQARSQAEVAKRAKPEGPDRELQAQLKQLDKFKNEALANLDDEKKLTGSLRKLGVSEDKIDDLVGRGIFDLEESSEKKRAAIEETVQAQIQALTGSQPSQTQAAPQQKVHGGWLYEKRNDGKWHPVREVK